MKTLLKVWLLLCVLCLFGFWIWFPSAEKIKGCMTTSMYDVELCPKSKNYVPLSQISRHLQNAVILTEDSAFYQHNGFDQEGIQHCWEKMKQEWRISCGGSTITQQLAKNMFLTKDKNFARKGVEALIAMRIEKTLKKSEILERYLNVVQFGKNIFGVKAAAQFYFKKHPSQLNPNEAAFLAMVLPNPEKYSQSFFRKDLTRFARRRIKHIVTSLHRYGRLNDGLYQQSLAQIDFFLRSGQQNPHSPEDEVELTAEDLAEMETVAEQDQSLEKKNHDTGADTAGDLHEGSPASSIETTEPLVNDATDTAPIEPDVVSPSQEEP
ncbi:monofunctional biosynthetic peptidoglycan transglycosylase [Pseudobdellovibrio exovorus]|uniref:Penicillin-binding protein n=1 Tax=Pseudobdellovibrio exovorus JSS TaxID=1184267 RepID=M4VTM9_9BACT|nr:monofunctional biosynthetic peptidoglycan transglycosylase [Pseudobdellovibrio exovorus]AGH96549.1 penicillin-binding protein [Pseudobdellovibrio exovorus JSS]